MSLNTTKACQDTNIPTKILKENADIFSDFLFAYYNASVVKSSKFPSILTLADIIPVFKKGDKECKNNYRPVNILPNMSKIFESVSVAFEKVIAHNIVFCLCLKNGNVQ